MRRGLGTTLSPGRPRFQVPPPGDARGAPVAEEFIVTGQSVGRGWLEKGASAARSPWLAPSPSPELGLLGAIALFSVVAVQMRTGFGGEWFARLCTNWLYDAVGLVTGVICCVRGLRSGQKAWLWIAAGILAWTFGDLYYTLALQDRATQPFPSFADVGYLGFYPPVFVGVALLVRSSVIEFGGVVWLDGLIAGFTVCSLATALVLGPVWRSSTGSFAAVATNLAYPAGDALLLALIFCVLGLSGWKLGRMWLLIAGGFVLFGVADS